MKKTTLDALEIALAETPEGPPREGEFTVREYMQSLEERGNKCGRQKATQILDGLVRSGKLSSRTGPINGTFGKIYGAPQ